MKSFLACETETFLSTLLSTLADTGVRTHSSSLLRMHFAVELLKIHAFHICFFRFPFSRVLWHSKRF